jgi:hypothetical protein
MLDNLRDQAASSSIFKDDEPPQPLPDEPKPPKRKRTFDQITGTTALQRFVLIFMLFVLIVLMGAGFLVLMGKVVPSF